MYDQEPPGADSVAVVAVSKTAKSVTVRLVIDFIIDLKI